MQHSVSVIVVSNGRPDALRRCLLGLSQIDHPKCEVIVVADSVSWPAMAQTGLGDRIKAARCDVPNISVARNAGLALAAGDIVAFIDDDAVPEPTWLSYLTAPFASETVMAAGGFVRGRNGIDFQWRARLAFGDAETTSIQVDGARPTLMTAGPGRAVKTEGTNMAIRRATLIGMGGFDEAFAFYLDETDINLRLAQSSAVTAIVPMAQVHHGFAPSVRRSKDRVPRTLFQIGASLAVFLRKHGGTPYPTPHVPRAAQRRRLLSHMVAGRLMPGDVRRLLQTFDAGWVDGLKRDVCQHPRFATPPPFLDFGTRRRTHKKVFARSWRKVEAMSAAKGAVDSGQIVSLYLMSPTGLFHRRYFDESGVWIQTGGQFGKSDRTDSWWSPWRAQRRSDHEAQKIAALRDPQSADYNNLHAIR
ncbi:glycosyltransferase family 2 protein [Loktanella salsilacus]|uniref:glycosyltransferase family 2 protein n=1 Tax=Loktanella salsilacus TaxID=195913 RepID=UPI003735CDA0